MYHDAEGWIPWFTVCVCSFSFDPGPQAVTAGEMFSIVYEGLTGHREGQLPIEHGVFYAACVLEALVYMHGKGIVYR